MKHFVKRSFSVFLVVLMCLSVCDICIPIVAEAAAKLTAGEYVYGNYYYYPEGTQFISSIRYGQAETSTDATSEATQDGHVMLDVDFNSGVSGKDYIYLGYKTSTDINDSIATYFRNGHSNGDDTKTFTVNGKTLDFTVTGLETSGKQDLNSDASGDIIYLYSTKDAQAGLPIIAISASASDDATIKAPAGYHTVERDDSGEASECNNGISGDYVYIYFDNITAYTDVTEEVLALKESISKVDGLVASDYTAESWKNYDLYLLDTAKYYISIYESNAWNAGYITAQELKKASESLDDIFDSLEPLSNRRTVSTKDQWDAVMAEAASQGGTWNITLGADIIISTNTGGKLSPVPEGATVNLDMNNHNIRWDLNWESSNSIGCDNLDDLMADNYESDTYSDGEYFGLITNNGTFNITGSGVIKNKKVENIISIFEQVNRDNSVQRLATIVNSGNLTVGENVTIDAYLSFSHNSDTSYSDNFLYNFGIYSSGGTVNSSAKINVGGFTGASQSDTSGRAYDFCYGIYGDGNTEINVTGGNILVDSFAGGLTASGIANSAHIYAASVGVYGNNVSIAGNTTINVLSKNWEYKTQNNNAWENGIDHLLSVGVMYTGENYPVIGPSVDVVASFEHIGDSESVVYVPCHEDLYWTNVYSDSISNNTSHVATPVAGVAFAINNIGVHTEEKTFDNDGGFFGNTSPYESVKDTRLYRTAQAYHSGVNTTVEAPIVNNATNDHIRQTSAIVNGAPGNIGGRSPVNAQSGVAGQHSPAASSFKLGSQYLVVYRCYIDVNNIKSVSFAYDSAILDKAAVMNVGSSANDTSGIMPDNTAKISFTDGAKPINERYYQFQGAYYEVLETSDAVLDNRLNDIESGKAQTPGLWSGSKAVFPNDGVNVATQKDNVIIIYMDYQLFPSAVRVVADNIDAEIKNDSTSASFTTTYTGFAPVPGKKFKLEIIDMGEHLSVDENDTSDDKIVTDLYDITGEGSDSDNGKIAVTYRYSADGKTWQDGLPVNAGTYTIEVNVPDDTTLSSISVNRKGIQCYITCEIKKATFNVLPYIQGSPTVGSELTVNTDMLPKDMNYTISWQTGMIKETSDSFVVPEIALGTEITAHIVMDGYDSDNYEYNNFAVKTPIIKAYKETYEKQIQTDMFDVNIPDNIVYDGKTHSAEVSKKDEYKDYCGNVSLKYNGDSKLPKNAGSYIVTADVDVPEGSTSEYYAPYIGLYLGTLVISPAEYVVTYTPDDKVYDATVSATASITLDPNYINEDVKVVPGYSFEFENKNVGTDIPVKAINLSITGSDASNFVVKAKAASGADITPATLFVNAFASEIYDGTTSVSLNCEQIDGFVGNDNAATLQVVNITGESENKNVGSWYVKNIKAEIVGENAGNYQLVIDGFVEITPAILYCTATAVDRDYESDNYDVQLTLSDFSGFVGDDNISTTVSGLGTLSDNTPGIDKPVTDIRFDWSDAPSVLQNYTLEISNKDSVTVGINYGSGSALMLSSWVLDGSLTLHINKQKNVLISVILPFSYYLSSFDFGEFNIHEHDIENIVLHAGMLLYPETFDDYFSLKNITIMPNVQITEAAAFDSCFSLENIIVDENHPQYSSEDGILYEDKDKTILFIYPAGKSETTFNVPANVEYMYEGAFAGCYALTSITVDEDNKNFTSENGVLFNKDKTKIIQYPVGKTETNYIIPESVTNITRMTFAYNANLENMVIPRNVTEIAEKAFYDCDSLSSITIQNKDCIIYDDASTIPAKTAIYGYSGSTAQQYAEKYSRTFVELPDNIVSISINTLPNKTVYATGSEFNAEGLTIECEYESGTKTTITDSSMWSILGFDSSAAGTCTVTVDVDGKTATFDVTIKERPAKITSVIATAGELEVLLSWGISAEVKTTEYRIYRKAPGTEYELIKTIKDRHTQTYLDKDVIENETYSYYVVGFDPELEGSSVPSDVTTCTVIPDITAPTVLNITPLTGSFLKETVNVVITGEDNIGIAGYDIYYSKDNGTTWTKCATATASGVASINTKTIADGETRIKVIAYDAHGNTSNGNPVRSWYIDNSSPDKVQNVHLIEVYASSATLQWDAVEAEDYAGFILDLKDGTGYKRIASNFNQLGYQLKNLRPDTEYTYRVAAVDRLGNIGEYSDDFTFTTPSDTTAPVINKISKEQRCKDSVKFTATVMDDCDVVSVAIDISYDRVDWTTIHTITYGSYSATRNISYTIDMTPYNEGSVFVRAVAEDSSGNISDTNSATAADVEYYIDRTAPSAPSNVSATGSLGYVNISWDMASEDDVGTYYVYRAESEDGTYKQIAGNLKNISYADTSTKENVTYYYKVAFTDSVGNMSAYSDIVSAKMSEDTQAPVVKSISPADGSSLGASFREIVVSVSDNNRLSTVTVEYKTSALGLYKVLTESTALSGQNSGYISAYINIADYSDGDEIYIRAKVKDSAGLESDYSKVYKYVIDKTSPKIVDLEVNIKDGLLTATWKNNGEKDLSGYRIYLQKDGGSSTQIATRSANGDKYTVTKTITAGGTYVLKVTAYDVMGNSSSESKTLTVEKQKLAPKAVIIGMAEMEVGVEEYFDASSSVDTDGMVFSYYWDFGDGTTGNTARVIKRYEAAGEYTVTLTVTDNDGLTNSVIHNVSVAERGTVGALEVTVLDEKGKAVPYVPVTFDLGTDKQTVFNTNSMGVATIKASAGRHNVGVYVDQEWLPVQKTAVIVAGTTTKLTIRVTSGSVVEGSFEVNRMTPEEIEAAGLDEYATANRNVYAGSVKVSYGSGSYTVNYNRADNKVLGFNYINDSDIKDTNPSGSRKPVAVGSIKTDNEDVECIAIIDVPAEISYLKECFDIQLHILNNATEDFSILNSTINLYLPDGLSLVRNAAGFNQSLTVEIPVINTRETTIRWMVTGDKEGEYNLAADFIGTLSIFNEPVTGTFETDEPIKVYGASAVNFTYDFDSAIRYGAFYFNIGMENISNIDVNYPQIGLSEDSLSNIVEQMEIADNSGGNMGGRSISRVAGEGAGGGGGGGTTSDEINDRTDTTSDYSNLTVYDLGIVLEDETGYKKYLVDMPKVLAPGQKIYHQYVCYGIADVTKTGYFNDAVITDISHEGINIVVNSVEFSHYGADDPIVNFENIFGQNKDTVADYEKIQQAYDYLINHENFMYWKESNVNEGEGFLMEYFKSVEESERLLHDSMKMVFTLDFERFTETEAKQVVRAAICELIASDAFITQVNKNVDTKYLKLAKEFVSGTAGLVTGVDSEIIENLASDEECIRKISSELRTVSSSKEGSSKNLGNRVYDILLGACGSTLTAVGKSTLKQMLTEEQMVAQEIYSGAFKVVTSGFSTMLDVICDSLEAYYRGVEIYNAVLLLQATKEESMYLLTTLMNSTYDKANNENLRPYENRMYKIVNIVATEFYNSINEKCDQKMEILSKELNSALIQNAIELGLNVVSDILGLIEALNPLMLVYSIIGAAFEVIDDLYLIGEEYEKKDKIDFVSVISWAVQKECLENAEKYIFDSDNVNVLVSNEEVALNTLIMLKYAVTSRIIGQRYFYEYAKVLEERAARITSLIALSLNSGLGVAAIIDSVVRAYADGSLNKIQINPVTGIEHYIINQIDANVKEMDDLYRNDVITILNARDTLFNSKSTIVTIPDAPELSLDYYNLCTNQSFSDEYQYCFGNGEWKQCDGNPISFTVKNIPQTLRVRKMANGTELSGNIASVNIYPRPSLRPQVGVRFDGETYTVSNLEDKYNYEVILTNSLDNSFDTTEPMYIITKDQNAITTTEKYSYMIIRSQFDNLLQVYYSDAVTRAVENTVNMDIKATEGGRIEGKTNCFEADVVSLNAVPDSGYVFKGWYFEDDFVSNDTYFEFNAYEGAKLTAVFEEILPESVTVSMSENTVYEGQTFSLSVDVTPAEAYDKTVTWSSSNEKIITVAADGTVTAVSPGEAVVTAKTKNNIAASCKITVLQAEIVDLRVENIKVTQYDEGETFDRDSFQVVASFNVGKDKVITDYIVSGYDNSVGIKTVTVSYMGLSASFDVEVVHVPGDWKVEKESSCTSDGIKTIRCEVCDELLHEDIIEANGHKDENSDNICDVCEMKIGSESDCSHICHVDGFFSFLWKIVRFLYKIFNVQKYCQCGVAHY